MFDGNHRSRRTVNLGRSSRRTAAGGAAATNTASSSIIGGSSRGGGSGRSNKSSILEHSKRLREERALQQKKILSARCIQRHVRGHIARRALQKQLLKALQAASSSVASASASALSFSQHTQYFNIFLGLLLDTTTAASLQQKDAEIVSKLLKDYASSRLLDMNKSRSNNNNNSNIVLSHRILQATLHRLRMDAAAATTTATTNTQDSTWPKTILEYNLGLLQQQKQSSSAAAAAAAAAAARTSSAPAFLQLGGVRGILTAVETLMALLDNKNNDDNVIIVGLVWTLLQDAIPDNSVAGRALLGAIQWSSSSCPNSSDLKKSLLLVSQEGKQQQQQQQHDASYQCFIDLVSVVTTDRGLPPPLPPSLLPQQATTQQPTQSQQQQQHEQQVERSLAAATRRLVAGGGSQHNQQQQQREVEILSNALAETTSSSAAAAGSSSSSSSSSTVFALAVIRFLRVVVERRPQLLCMAGIAARGGVLELEKMLSTEGDATTRSSATTAAGPMDLDSDSDDEDDDDGDLVHVRGPAQVGANKVQRTSGSRMTASRQELLTLPKLDRMAQDTRDKWRKEIMSSIRQQQGRGQQQQQSRVVALAGQIGNADLWLAWGQTLLSSPQASEELSLAREAYISALAALLQSSGATGLRPRASAASKFLTKLAFSPIFLERLWRYVLVQTNNNSDTTDITYTAFSVFCDVFAHHLIALMDDQFLALYTTMQGPRTILAEAVIVHLRTILYELYWTRAVRVKDVQAAFDGTPKTSMPTEQLVLATRGQLLLTGTKLFNSLYERWCRLVRHAPFCDESTWLFPPMTTLSEHSAVVNIHSNRLEGDDNGGMDVDSDSDNDEPMSTADEESEALADAFRDPKMARVLTSIPQALPFDRRVKLFDSLLRADKMKTQDESRDMRDAMHAMMRGLEGEMSSRARVEIRRDQLYSDSMQQLNRLGPKLKRKVQVSFINQHGAQEAGIDGGGVFKEFIDDLIKDAFSLGETTASHKLFAVTPLETLAVNVDCTHDPALLADYEFLGRAVGKAVYESILVEPQFCLPFLNQLLGKPNSMEELKNYDPEYYKNLTKLLTLTADEINSMGLTFELPGSRSGQTIELMPGGSTKSVTKENAIHYVTMVANRLLNIQGAVQVRAFLHGFRDLIPAPWVRLFSAYELQKIISGDDSVRGIDVASFKASMQYAAGYHPSQDAVRWFWEIVDELPAEQQRKLLKFMTSCSRQPLLGFASLEPAPCIQQIRLRDDLFLQSEDEILKQAPLPMASTCMNLLKLPNYRSKELMRIKLMAAIESGAGFELT